MTASASSTPGGEPPANGAPAAPSGAAVSEERLEKLQNQLEVLMGCMTTMASQQASSQQMMEQRMAVLSEATARCNRRVRRASATSESLATLSVLAGPSGALPRTCSSESMKDELEIEKQLGHLGSTMSLQRVGSSESAVSMGNASRRGSVASVTLEAHRGSGGRQKPGSPDDDQVSDVGSEPTLEAGRELTDFGANDILALEEGGAADGARTAESRVIPGCGNDDLGKPILETDDLDTRLRKSMGAAPPPSSPTSPRKDFPTALYELPNQSALLLYLLVRVAKISRAANCRRWMDAPYGVRAARVGDGARKPASRRAGAEPVQADHHHRPRLSCGPRLRPPEGEGGVRQARAHPR